MKSPRALEAPSEDIVVISEALAQRALEGSRRNDRRRVILPFHKSHEDALHRMFNAVQLGTYVRPHRHARPPRSEVFLVLRGAIDVVVFHEDGSVRWTQRLAAGTSAFGIDLSPGLFHTFVVQEPDTLLYELKSGPYVESSAKDFATWAPDEGTPEAALYLAQLTHLLDSPKP